MKKLLLLLFLIPIIGFSQPNEAIILKAFTNSKTYKTRVYPDAGKIRSDYVTKAHYMMSELNGMATTIRFSWFGESASKFRTSTIYNYFTKLYSTVGTNDATQTTELNQPYLSGNIAPNERYCLNNPNGSTKFITHPTISFDATEAWSVTTVFNWNANNTGGVCLLCGGIDANGTLRISNGGFSFSNLSAGTIYDFAANSNLSTVGKIAIMTFVSNGTTISMYKNGVYNSLVTPTSTAIIFSQLIKSWQTSRDYNGKLYAHIIRSGALTQSQVTNEYNFFRSIYPEIETVKIGSQDWATSNLDVVATPQGNVISNITENVNVEKIPTLDFTNSWTIAGAAVINDANNFTTTGNGGIYKSILIIGKYYKITIAGSVNSGTLVITNSASNTIYYTTSVGAFSTTIFIKANTDGAFYLKNLLGSVTVTTLSVQEIGWAGSTELYDNIYAATAGIDEVKTYAAVKASAMWSYYNNDAANGAIYGKLYNWYAAKLLQMDIDYYNTANPSTPWGYRVPTQADFTTLQTTLGGASVAGGKMKKEGLNYWTTPNLGADNSSGFSALGGGIRYSSGGFGALKVQSHWITSDSHTGRNVVYNGTEIISSGAGFIAGLSIRLIKN